MRLRHLEVFNAVMEAGSITGAAAILGVSQSWVTKVLQHFEQQLGMRLFGRNRGRLTPIPEARLLYRESDKLVASLNTVRRVAAGLPGRADSAVRVVATPSLATALLPAAVTAWRRQFPTQRCEIASHHTAQMVQGLLLCEAEFGLSLQNPYKAGIRARCLASHHMLVAAAPGTWSTQDCQVPLPLGRFGERVIGLAPDDPLGVLVQVALDAHDIAWDGLTTAQTHVLAVALAAGGHGLALVDPFTARAAAVQTRPCTPPMPVSLWLLQREDAEPAPASRMLIQAIRAEAQRVCAA